MEPLSEQPTSGSDWEDLSPPEEGSLPFDYRVELPVFEGPLDLLLHLIRKHEIDIFDIPISLITDKYLAYINWMQALNLDVAGEFLVMASTLAHIKSRMLLPSGEGEDEEEEEEIDPREELVRRLLEYQRYKEAAEELRQRPILDRDVFAHGTATDIPKDQEDESPFSEVSVFKLIEALDRAMRKAKRRVSHDIIVERISIVDRIHELADKLLRVGEATFEELFDEALTKMAVIVTFIALLEMTRLRMVRLHQADGSEVIYVRSLLGAAEDVEQALASARLEE
jgi:segregation and condensation protein A